MKDGKPIGFWSSGPGRAVALAHLLPGQRYRVIRPFADFDRSTHPIGEEWTYLGTSFLPHDDGRSIFVTYDGKHEHHIRFQDRPQEQADILANLQTYLTPISP